MWSPRNAKYLQPSVYSKRSTSYVDKDFQLKYTRYILTVAAFSILAFLIPAFYYSNQNYDIFFKLSDMLNPDLAHYIAKERLNFNVLFFITLVANMIFWFIFSKNMTAKIAGPAKILRNHIRLLSRGDFSLPPVRLRDDDEFKELVNTYNYLFTLMRVQNQRELEDLKRILPAVTNPIAKELVKNMMDERAMRLDPTSSSRSEELVASPDSRHAS